MAWEGTTFSLPRYLSICHKHSLNSLLFVIFTIILSFHALLFVDNNPLQMTKADTFIRCPFVQCFTMTFYKGRNQLLTFHSQLVTGKFQQRTKLFAHSNAMPFFLVYTISNKNRSSYVLSLDAFFIVYNLQQNQLRTLLANTHFTLIYAFFFLLSYTHFTLITDYY